VWLPCVLIAAAVVLFAIHQAPAELTLYTQSRATRLVVGPLHGPVVAEFTRGLRQSLAPHREFTVVGADVVQACLHSTMGDAAAWSPEPSPSLAWIRATRGLKAQFYVGGELQRHGDEVAAVVEVWEASSERVVHRFAASHRNPVALGSVLGDSVVARLFDVQPAR
jgi:hypothetical protein